MGDALQEFIVLFVWLSVLYGLGWVMYTLYRIRRVSDRGAILTDCRDPDCPSASVKHYLGRWNIAGYDLRAHGNVLDIVREHERDYERYGRKVSL